MYWFWIVDTQKDECNRLYDIALSFSYISQTTLHVFESDRKHGKICVITHVLLLPQHVDNVLLLDFQEANGTHRSSGRSLQLTLEQRAALPLDDMDLEYMAFYLDITEQFKERCVERRD